MYLAYYFVQLIFIDQLSSLSDGLGRYSKEEVHLIFIIFVLLSILLSIFTYSIEIFLSKVASGNIEVHLTKPISEWCITLIGWCNPLNFIKFVMILTFALLFVSFPDISNRTCHWLLFTVVLGCIITINLCFFITFNCITFITGRKMPVEYIHEMIYGLSFIPIALYPTRFVKWLLFMLPMAFSASLPVSFLLGTNEWKIDYFLLSTALIVAVTLVAFRKTRAMFNGSGG